jgi:hypothetical protein
MVHDRFMHLLICKLMAACIFSETLSSNMHTIRCEVCTFSSNDFVTIQNTRLEIWQVK